MKINNEKNEVLYFYRKARHYTLHVKNSNTLRVEKFKFPGAVFTSDRRRNEIDTPIDKANAVVSELYRSVITKPELLNTAKLSVF